MLLAITEIASDTAGTANAVPRMARDVAATKSATSTVLHFAATLGVRRDALHRRLEGWPVLGTHCPASRHHLGRYGSGTSGAVVDDIDSVVTVNDDSELLIAQPCKGFQPSSGVVHRPVRVPGS